MERTPEHRVDERQMHESYLQREGTFRQEAGRLWDEESLRARIRANVDLTAEQRMDAYIEGYRGLERRFNSLTEGFSRDVSARIVAAERTLFAGRSEHFAQMLTQAAQTPDDRLESLFNSARRAGLADPSRGVRSAAGSCR